MSQQKKVSEESSFLLTILHLQIHALHSQLCKGRTIHLSMLCFVEGMLQCIWRRVRLRWCFIQSIRTEWVSEGENSHTQKNGDDKMAQGVILTISDGPVIWVLNVSVTCYQHAEQIVSDTLDLILNDLIYCRMNSKWMNPRDWSGLLVPLLMHAHGHKSVMLIHFLSNLEVENNFLYLFFCYFINCFFHRFKLHFWRLVKSTVDNLQWRCNGLNEQLVCCLVNPISHYYNVTVSRGT